MAQEQTSAAVQRYLEELAGHSPAEPVVRALLDRSVRRLHHLCATLLYRSYPRLTRPPVNLQADEMLGAVVERLLKALREARPASARQFFALACRHLRWELSDRARRLDKQPQDEREAFDLVRIQGMTQTEAARVLGVSVITVKRRLSRGLQALAAALGDLSPGGEDPGAP